MKVHLLNLDRSADPSHHRTEHSVFLNLARKSRENEPTEDPEEADLILLCGFLQHSMFPTQIWRHPVYRKHRRKCVRFGGEDNALAWVPGLYPSLLQRHACRWFRSGAYPHTALSDMPPDNLPLPGPPGSDVPPFLYSFMGAFDSNPVRPRIGALRDDRAFIEDTSCHAGRGDGQAEAVYQDFHERYARCLANSLFVLCPRGYGASSIRLFETMKAARVPVIVSDDWTPPDGPDWGRFSLRVRERDIARIPDILRAAEPRVPEMASLAFVAWRQFFSADIFFDRVIQTASRCLPDGSGMELAAGRLRQVLTWRFLRQGLLQTAWHSLR